MGMNKTIPVFYLPNPLYDVCNFASTSLEATGWLGTTIRNSEVIIFSSQAVGYLTDLSPRA